MKGGTKQMPKVVQAANAEEIAPEIIAQSIEKIAAAMEAIRRTRLTRSAIVTLIHHNSKVPRRDIELVLNNLDALEQIWLKPKAKKP